MTCQHDMKSTAVTWMHYEATFLLEVDIWLCAPNVVEKLLSILVELEVVVQRAHLSVASENIRKGETLLRFEIRDPFNSGDFPCSMRTSNVQKRLVEKRPTSKKAEAEIDQLTKATKRLPSLQRVQWGSY